MPAAMPSASRPWLLRSGKSHRPGSKLQRQIRRALIAAQGPVSTTVLIAHCYPRGISRRHRGAYRNIWKAAIKVCVCLGRAPHLRGRPNMWRLGPPFQRRSGLPGQLSPSFNWSNKPKNNLTSPFGQLTSLAQVSQAVGVLVGSPMTSGLPINFQDQSWFAIANFSQYLYVADDPATIAKKLKSGDVINGIGLFGSGLRAAGD
jgi:hypothetical protein